MALTSSRHFDRPAAVPPLLVLLSLLAVLSSGCAAAPVRPTKKFSELLNRYPPAQEPLQVRELNTGSVEQTASLRRGGPLTFLVHPAYALFFRDAKRSTFAEAEYDLLKRQFEAEERFISEIAKTDNPLVLVLPGNYAEDSVAPAAYTRYLNEAAGGSPSVFAVYSETSNSGAVPIGTVVVLHGFLRSIKPSSVLVGGGFIGRCQREFYNQIVHYAGETSASIVPEISTVSPDDVSERDAREMLDGILRGDYSDVTELIERKTQPRVRVSGLPEDLLQRAAPEAGADGAPVPGAPAPEEPGVAPEIAPLQAPEAQQAAGGADVQEGPAQGAPAPPQEGERPSDPASAAH